MTLFACAVFALVYVGMMAGKFPGLALDRTGIALVGAIALVAGGAVASHDAWIAIDASTLMLLLGLMVVSAQLRLGGFYALITERITLLPLSPPTLLGLIVAAAAGLSALLANDIVCLAVPPILIEACARRRMAPMPFLLALACASNVGSALTLIGNPQNMLIGQQLGLSFTAYMLSVAPPVVLGLVATWAVIAWQWRGRWELTQVVPDAIPVPFHPWQTTKGLVVLGALLVVFFGGFVPRDIAAMSAAGVLLCSRQMNSHKMLGLIDWSLLLLFSGLFVVNFAFKEHGGLNALLEATAAVGIDLHQPTALFGAGVLLSNLVSNVPATMLLLPTTAHTHEAGVLLAISTTLAGNLLLVGSIANLIVADQAARMGVKISALDHARTGVPVSLVTLAIAALFLLC